MNRVQPDQIQVDPRLAFVDGKWISVHDHAAGRVSALWAWSMIGFGLGMVAATYLSLWVTIAVTVAWTLLCFLAIVGHVSQKATR
jgi:hypothetical protein